VCNRRSIGRGDRDLGTQAAQFYFMQALVVRRDADMWLRVAQAFRCARPHTLAAVGVGVELRSADILNPCPYPSLSFSLCVCVCDSDAGEYKRAEYCFQRVLKLRPGDLDALYGKASMALCLGDARKVRTWARGARGF
jgi:hypothetical protein